MTDDSYFMDYVKQLGKGTGKKQQDKTKKAGPRRLALAQPQKQFFILKLKDIFSLATMQSLGN